MLFIGYAIFDLIVCFAQQKCLIFNDYTLRVHVDFVELFRILINTCFFIIQLTANATGAVEYGIMVFASDVEVVVSILDNPPPPQVIIQELRNIGLNRRKHL